MTLGHWDEVRKAEPPWPGMGGTWSVLGAAAGAVGVGLNRIELAPGEVSTPAHFHLGDEEIFFVLGGAGLLWSGGETHAIGAGDCVVRTAGAKPHTFRGGDDGLDLLGFGTRTRMGGAHLPDVGAYWLQPLRVWVDTNPGEHPFDREQHLEWPEPSPRPESIVNVDDVEGAFGGLLKHLARAAGAARSGLNLYALPAGEEGAPPHCHSADEELFVVLDGEGVLELWAPPDPSRPLQTEPAETHELRRGHVVARPPGTRVAHSFRAGAPGLTLLVYGTREPNDLIWYPRSNKVFLRGLGVIARLELLEYSDGEPL